MFKAAAAFVEMFSTVPDPVLQVARKADSINGKIAWTLLGTALFQNCSYSEISALLNALYEKFPNEKLWALPVPKESEIAECISQVWGNRSWSMAEHTSGIFWSVGHFVRRHEDLLGWLNSRTPAEVWRDLGEIYFMGKGNPRPKACAAIYRLISAAPVGLGLETARPQNPNEKIKMPSLPMTMGARRFLAILGPAAEGDFASLDSTAKQKMANEMFIALNPENPYFASHALQFFLEQGKDDYICWKVTDHCKTCPLYEYCSYAERHGR